MTTQESNLFDKLVELYKELQVCQQLHAQIAKLQSDRIDELTQEIVALKAIVIDRTRPIVPDIPPPPTGVIEAHHAVIVRCKKCKQVIKVGPNGSSYCNCDQPESPHIGDA